MTDSHDGDERDADASPSESRREESPDPDGRDVDERTSGEGATDGEADVGNETGDEAVGENDNHVEPFGEGDPNHEAAGEAEPHREAAGEAEPHREMVAEGETDGGRTANPDSSAGGIEADPATAPTEESTPSPTENPLEWFRTTNNELVIVFKDVASSVAIVVAIGLVLFAVSGVWPPMVAIESGSMEPHMQKGDLVFIMENDRLTPDEAVAETGVVTQEVGQETGYRTFGGYGDVIIFQPQGASQTPIIHRAHLYVEEGENWYDRADQDHIRADNCQELRQCPAPYAGFVTKGDNSQTNEYYDQANQHAIVRPEQIQGTAEVRIPWLGCIRLEFSGTNQCRPGVAS